MPTTVAPRGKTITALFGKQTVDYATPATVYVPSFILSHTLEEKQPFVDDPVLGLARTNDRDATDPAPGLPVAQGNIVVPVDFNHFPLHLNALFGSAQNSGSSDPYTHVFASGSETLPWLTMELAIKGANAGTIYMQYLGMVASKLTMDWSRAAGFAKATLEYIFRSEAKNGASAAGSPPAPWARQPVPEAIATVLIGGSPAAKITRINATYDNKLSPQDFLGDAHISGLDLAGESTFAGTLGLRFRDAPGQAATQLYDLAVSQTGGIGAAVDDVAIQFASGSDRLLQFEAPRVWFERTGPMISGPGLIEQNFAFRTAQSVSAPMLTVTSKSAVASYN